MAEYCKERFIEMIRSLNIFLSIFDLNILYDENYDMPACALMALSDGKGNVVGTLTGPSYDKKTRKQAYNINASTQAFPKISATVTSSKKIVSNQYNFDRGVHYFYDIEYNVTTNNVLANNISGNFEISDPISNIDPRETTVEREIDFNLKASQKPNELFSISSKNAKITIREKFCEKNQYIGTRTIRMEHSGGEITLMIEKGGNSFLRYVGINGECRANATILDSPDAPRIEVCCIEKGFTKDMTELEKKAYQFKELKRILEGESYSKPFSDDKTTVNHFDIKDDRRGNILQLFEAISSYVPLIDMHEIPDKACTFMDYLGSDDCAPIHVFYSLMSVAFGFLNDEELTKLVGKNIRKLEDIPVVDKQFGTVILPQHRVYPIVKE